MKKLIAAISIVGVTFVTCILANGSLFSFADSIDGKTIRIIYTNDLHSHIDPHKAYDENKKLESYGGYAEMSAVINHLRETDMPTLTVDAGDFAVGTIYNQLYTSDAPDLTMLKKMKFDAVTLGNHEFDYGPDAMAKMIEKAGPNPPLVASTISAPAGTELDKLIANGRIQKNMIIEKGGIKIGLMGLLGHDAVTDISNKKYTQFADYIDVAKQQVQELKNQGAQLIIALSHSGTDTKNPASDSSEDVQLAKQVPDINFVASAHTHTLIPTPIMEGNTIVSSTGCYAQDVGVLDLVNQGGIWKIKNAQMEPVLDKYPKDKSIQDEAQRMKSTIDKNFFSKYGLHSDQVITNIDFNLSADDVSGFEEGVGKVFTDSFAYEFNHKAEYVGKVGNPVSKSDLPIVFTADGVSRGGFFSPNITVEDIYGAVNLGYGPDGTQTYPLSIYYLKGDELKDVMEASQTVGESINSGIVMHFANIRYYYNNYRLPLNRVSNVEVKDINGNWSAPDKDKLYPIITNYYIGQMSGSITGLTYGLLSITPKKADGSPACEPFADGSPGCNLANSVLLDKNGDEIKEWKSMVDYLSTFKTLPEYYKDADSGKIDLPANPITLVQNPNIMLPIAIGALVIFAGIIAGLVLLIKRILKHKKRKAQQKIQQKA
ncbi:MAG: bifunctional metallophosphatase/5'-nucleotidase [Bifidobacteriaceae bacterium]|jgi:2',3'-cyclic-nucleotide 2'-phosphodiesterase (5'-nucleotidase family)|nr:bifunctional metallophosphatase/5'-nucleotidase [Bifidobacteriaceae bacterium]